MSGSPRILRGAVVAMIAFLIFANTAAADNILRRGNHDEPETLDPQKSDGIEEFWVQMDMFIGLTKIDAHGKLVPDLAERWEISSDGLTWAFHLRPNLAWSDGSPLTADDFVWSLRRAVDPATAASYASLLYSIVNAEAINAGKEKNLASLGVEAPDPLTLIVHLTQPTAFLAGIMSVGIAFPLPRHAVETYGAQWTRPGKIVCSGAFEMKDWIPQEFISMARNPHYYAATAVKLDGVEWRVYSDDDTSLRSFRNGELDISRVPEKEVSALQQELPAALHTGTNLWTRYLIANVQRAPLNDVRLRQALSMSIDREIIADRVVPHGQQAAYSLIPQGIEGYTPQPPDWAKLPQAERVALARKLVAEAGFGPSNPVRLEIIYTPRQQNKDELGAMRAMWHQIGVEATLIPEENQVVETTQRHHDFQLLQYGWVADYPDPWTFLSNFQSNAGGLNSADYRNPAFDALLDKAMHELDPKARMGVLEAAERMISNDQPIIPISFDETPRLVSARVQNYFDNALDQHRSADMWLKPAGS